MKVRVDQVRPEARGVVSLRLVAADGAALPSWEAGAHLDLHLPSGLVRQYSLCGAPEDELSYTIAVLRDPSSRGGSVEVHDAVREGDLITIAGPRNHFALTPAGSYVFVAGGIGITPILAMAREASRAGVPWELVYGGRTAAGMAFTDELSAIEGGTVSLVREDTDGLLDLARIVRDAPPESSIYCCGPTGLIDAVVEVAGTLRPELPVRFERFSALPVDTSADDGFEVQLAQTGATVLVKPGTSVLHAVREVGVEVESSCEEGTCGTCEAAVLDGIPDHRDSILTPEERAANDVMMLCVSRSCSRVLVLDL